jgi:multiple sugar transport system permease protein
MSTKSVPRRLRQRLNAVYAPIERRFPVSWLLVSPGGLLLALVVAVPIVTAIALSFTEYNLTFSATPVVVGVENFIREVVFNRQFLRALFNTAVFVVGAVTLELLFGFGLALLLWGNFPGRGVFRALLLTPMFVAPVAAGLMFRFIFDSQMGVVPHLLSYVGLGELGWFTDPALAMLTIIIADVWQWTPYMLILLLAGLESLPSAPYEAARIDGASRVEQFIDITLPLMRPVIAATVVIRTIDATKVFAKVYTMTSGGPGVATETLAWFIYKTGFQHYHLGIAASQAVTVLLMIIGLGYVQMFVIERGETDA